MFPFEEYCPYFGSTELITKNRKEEQNKLRSSCKLENVNGGCRTTYYVLSEKHIVPEWSSQRGKIKTTKAILAKAVELKNPEEYLKKADSVAPCPQ